MNGIALTIEAKIEKWPIAGQFRISRGAKRVATLVVATVRANGLEGRGECAPYPRYGETPEGVCAEIRNQAALVSNAGSVLDARDAINDRMPPGAARNALDCALWDLQAKIERKPVWLLADLDAPKPVLTAYTISLDTPERMAEAARTAARPLLKLKLGGDDAARIRAVRAAAPDARLIVDANEAWSASDWDTNLVVCIETGVQLIEQPFPSDNDSVLETLARPIPVCADESAHDARDIGSLVSRYDAVNVKLDKTGGLTGARAALEAARGHGLDVMLGCMVSTSLSMAPAMLLASRCDIVDLDGPLMLREDRANRIIYAGSIAHLPDKSFWDLS